MSSTVVKVSGLEGVQDKLNGLIRKVRLRYIRQAVNEAAKPLVEAVKSRIPKNGGRGSTGALRNSIGMVAKSKGHSVRAVVGPRSKMSMPRITVTNPNAKAEKATITRKKGAAKGKIQTNTPTRYAHLVEFGFIHVKGSTRTRVPPRPFMRPAWASQGGQKIVDRFTESLRSRLGL